MDVAAFFFNAVGQLAISRVLVVQAQALDGRRVDDAHLVFGRAVVADCDGVVEGLLDLGEGIGDGVGAINYEFFGLVGCFCAWAAFDVRAARLVASKMHLQGSVFALDDFEVSGTDGDQGARRSLVRSERMGAALSGLGEVVAKQRAAKKHDGRCAAKQAQVGVERPTVEDLGWIGGAQKGGGPFARSREQRGRVKGWGCAG